MKTELYPYQRRGVRLIQEFDGRVLVADEMGLGKSLEALAWVLKHDRGPTIVVCPKSLKWNWEREISKHLGKRAVILEGSKPKRGKLPTVPAEFTIINYDILKSWLPYLRRLKPKTIILDEVHYCKNRTAKRTKLVRRLCKGRPHVLALSGTPLTNRPAELWPILNLLLGDVFDSFYTFAYQFCNPKRTPWGWDFRGAKNLEELHKILKSLCMIRRRKKDVLKDLPAKQRLAVPLPIERPKEYDEAFRDLIGWLAKQSKRKASRAARAQRMVKVGYLKRLAAELKLKFVIEWIDEFLENAEGKLVVFGVHRAILHALHDHYQDISVLVDGGVTGKKRQQAVDNFQLRKSIRLFFGNIQAAGVGITLTAANTLAVVEFPWTPGELLQVEDRLHRIGQDKLCSCYYLVARGTVEERLCEMLQEKQEVLEQVLDGTGAGEVLDLYNQLEKELLQCHLRPSPSKRKTALKSGTPFGTRSRGSARTTGSRS